MTSRISVPTGQLAEFCRKWRIRELSLFGSVLRDDFGPESDVDVLVTFGPDACHSLWDLDEMREEVEAVFGRSVDLVDRASLKNPIRRARILASASGSCVRKPENDPADLLDIVERAEEAVSILGGKPLDEFLGSPMLRHAIAGCLSMLLAPMARVTHEFKEARIVPAWASVEAQRTALSEEYWNVDDAENWRIVREDLPDLIATLRLLIPAPPDIGETHYRPVAVLYRAPSVQPDRPSEADSLVDGGPSHETV